MLPVDVIESKTKYRKPKHRFMVVFDKKQSMSHVMNCALETFFTL